MEHRRAIRNGDFGNPFGTHDHNAQAGDSVPAVPFHADIITQTRDHVNRKLTEAIFITTEKPTLNTDRGWHNS